ncbi:preprotein translocase subunit [Leptolyngbya sp. Heron Island J]|uniref:preprotein translocase subunit SecE n=1 Tax=Leptolyngbya sp. Heron Island J TaxID=1385935 RepID=UPI0003B9D591|nr:preprotein translocase subunit SecE [Leptolyngbya sp. Heron Island J]ESA36677.1 preprotein translocase subunit [Leptolyngbya sp. Heron Island J]
MVKKDAKEVVKKQPSDSADSFDAGSFVKSTREELSKVVWPSRQQLISESLAVILMVGVSATLIYLVDRLFGWASRQVF